MAAPHATRHPTARAGLSAFPAIPRGEGFNVATAAAGLVGALAGLAWLLAREAPPNARLVLGAYGLSLVVLFTATTLHHWFPRSEALRRADHAAIHVAILGTASPVFLLHVGGPPGVLALAMTLALALAAGSLHLRSVHLPTLNLGLYLAVPAPLIVVAYPLATSVAPLMLGLLVAGLACYVVGAVIDARERPAPRGIGAHGLFHLCVLVASALVFGFVAGATAR